MKFAVQKAQDKADSCAGEGTEGLRVRISFRQILDEMLMTIIDENKKLKALARIFDFILQHRS